MSHFATAWRGSLTLLLMIPVACAATAPVDDWPTTEEATLYSLGVFLGRQLSFMALDGEELEQLQRGVRDAALDRPLRHEPEPYDARIKEFREARLFAIGRRGRLASQAFLDEAALAEGATRSETGLIFTELEAGSGESPRIDGEVVIHYHGTLPDGSVFDSTVDRGTPKRFPLLRTVKCWQEALPRMKPGGKASLVCPSALTYGDRGIPGRVPGGAVLLFEVELLEAHNPEASEEPPESPGADG